jgi:hypothetical protein
MGGVWPRSQGLAYIGEAFGVSERCNGDLCHKRCCGVNIHAPARS